MFSNYSLNGENVYLNISVWFLLFCVIGKTDVVVVDLYSIIQGLRTHTFWQQAPPGH